MFFRPRVVKSLGNIDLPIPEKLNYSRLQRFSRESRARDLCFSSLCFFLSVFFVMYDEGSLQPTARHVHIHHLLRECVCVYGAFCIFALSIQGVYFTYRSRVYDEMGAVLSTKKKTGTPQL